MLLLRIIKYYTIKYMRKIFFIMVLQILQTKQLLLNDFSILRYELTTEIFCTKRNYSIYNLFRTRIQNIKQSFDINLKYFKYILLRFYVLDCLYNFVYFFSCPVVFVPTLGSMQTFL
uniref:Uncharacterized protein n=1 Tax=Meloidogyne enterolobii TaxID=390850 RepID=A0A6V7VHX7_MELEN|nr:unnamed protein product [Meloidogyne enterolobii]